jgi:hypothetical protein
LKKTISSILLFLLFLVNKSEEFLYPIGISESNNKKRIYVVYQKNILHLELWSLDLNMKSPHKELMSSYNPAGIKFMPNEKGFSFIDNGRIKLKYFNKRSTINFEFEFPLYDFHTVEWLNEELFYFSAKAGKRFCIFLCNTNTKGIKNLIGRDLCSRTNDDFMYPQIISNKIFFISKSVHKLTESNYESFGNYKIMAKDLEQNLETNKQSEVILRKGEQAIAFLKMISEREGFFIAHPNKISKHERTLHLKYLHLQNINSEWQYDKLFDFYIPLKYLTKYSDERIYESILPFLPKHEGQKIYYPNCIQKENENTDLFEFDLVTSSIKRLTETNWPNSYFSPVIINGYIFFGGTVNDNCKFEVNKENELSLILNSKKLT